MPKLVNKGFYYEVQPDNSEIFASILNSFAGGMQQVIGGLREKKEQERKLQESRLDMQAKINTLDPEIQRNLLQNSPELRRFLIDPTQLKKDPDQAKALAKGLIEPMMPKIRGRTQLETATLLEKQESARKEGLQADKAGAEAALQAGVTEGRLGLMKSENPYEQILGLTGEVMTSDKLEALMTGVNDPKAAFTKYMSGVPGSAQFKEQARQKAEAQLLSEINPQTPEEMQGVKEMAMYVAGLGAMPKKMPKNLQRRSQDLDAWRIRVQEQGNQITQTRLNMETNGRIHALGDALSIRLKGTGKEGQAFALAEGMIRGGKFPTDLPPDVMALADRESKLLNINMDKLKYEQLLQQSPKLQMLLDLASKSATAGDDKGAQQYIKMAEETRKQLYGEDKPDPNERKRFWNTVMTAGLATVPGAGGFAASLSGTTIEQKAAMLKWAGSTASEIAEFAGQVPAVMMDAAGKGMITSPGQAQLSGSTEQEAGFQKWYKGYAEKLNLNKDPDAPEHKYDYRAAYRAGFKPDPSGHWPSQFKAADHPNRFVDGIDTTIELPSQKRVPAAPPPVYQAPPGSPSVQSLPNEQIQAMENMLRDIDKLSVSTLTPEKKAELLTLLQMIEEVKAGQRPFADLIIADR